MNTIATLYNETPDIFKDKSLPQILSFAGDGKLKDGNTTSSEFRNLLDIVQPNILFEFANYCLSNPFENSGLALQDIVNQIGKRLNFDVEYGLYKGKKNSIGFDGIWTTKDGYNIIIEVKTTDYIRINLSESVAKYRSALIDAGKIDKENSSILIVVGREDTGDLESQVRGSRYAWNIRIISTDALIQLLKLKETFNDAKTILQITELLKPREYTRVDKLIDLIFETSKDLQLDDIDTVETPSLSPTKKEKAISVNFYLDCIHKIQNHLKQQLIKQTKITYTTKDNSLCVMCTISRNHNTTDKQGRFWFAFHPHQQKMLEEYPTAYVAFGCGDSQKTLLIPCLLYTSDAADE